MYNAIGLVYTGQINFISKFNGGWLFRVLRSTLYFQKVYSVLVVGLIYHLMLHCGAPGWFRSSKSSSCPRLNNCKSYLNQVRNWCSDLLEPFLPFRAPRRVWTFWQLNNGNWLLGFFSKIVNKKLTHCC
jgi:hypothetical protein